jgi:hypothetical protein
MSEAIDAVCKELGLDAHNSLSRETVAHELMECARHERDPARICKIVLDESERWPAKTIVLESDRERVMVLCIGDSTELVNAPRASGVSIAAALVGGRVGPFCRAMRLSPENVRKRWRKDSHAGSRKCSNRSSPTEMLTHAMQTRTARWGKGTRGTVWLLNADGSTVPARQEAMSRPCGTHGLYRET